MKKILCLLITATLMLTSLSTAFAKPNNTGKHNNQKSEKQFTQQQKSVKQTTQQQSSKIKASKQEFKIKGSSVIKYGKYKLPIKPITQGMGATVKFDKETGVLTVEKGLIKIVINFKNKTVTVNGVEDTTSGIFTAKNDKKMTVLIKYIAKALGIRVSVGKEKITVEVPGLNLPTNVTVTPVGGAVIANTLNSSSLYLTAAANIVAGQATGGKAELYVGSKLVAMDNVITATDSAISFSTADETPTNAELQAAVPTGGAITVKLYNASNKSVISAVVNPTLVVDYVAPIITGITSINYNQTNGKLNLIFTGAATVGDTVDVTKITLFDPTLGKIYQLTNTSGTGSIGVVTNTNTIEITLGSADKLTISGFGSAATLTIAIGSLLNDAAGNTSPNFTVAMLPVTMIY